MANHNCRVKHKAMSSGALASSPPTLAKFYIDRHDFSPSLALKITVSSQNLDEPVARHDLTPYIIAGTAFSPVKDWRPRPPCLRVEAGDRRVSSTRASVWNSVLMSSPLVPCIRFLVAFCKNLGIRLIHAVVN
jgi:hypothetical protein